MAKKNSLDVEEDEDEEDDFIDFSTNPMMMKTTSKKGERKYMAETTTANETISANDFRCHQDRTGVP